ncbi:MAG: hypothetical protein O7G31_16450, partial [Calditrichaeota bacterium]|nr:hypothetical protein [Calditrichota bacterium]
PGVVLLNKTGEQRHHLQQHESPAGVYEKDLGTGQDVIDGEGRVQALDAIFIPSQAFAGRANYGSGAAFPYPPDWRKFERPACGGFDTDDALTLLDRMTISCATNCEIYLTN